MRFALLIGCLSLTACAVVVIVRLRGLCRKLDRFPPIYRNKTLLRWSSMGRIGALRLNCVAS
jgi:hypothetical protein